MNRIKYLREEKHIYQKDLAKLLGVSIPAINYYENEKRAMDTKTALILANYFDVSLDYLLGKSDYKNAWEEYDATHDIEKIKREVEEIENNNTEQEFKFAYHKEMEGLTDKEIVDALRFYKQIKYGDKDNK